MIEIPRKLAKRIRVVFARCLSKSSRGPFPPVEFRADQNGLTIRAKSQDAAIEFRQPGDYADQRFAIPFDVLKQFEGGKAEPIRFEANKTSVAIALPNASDPQRVEITSEQCYDKFPETPAELSTNESRLLAAIRDALDVTDSESVRYALNCIQLHGDRGSVAATDGRQLLVQYGFDFPWEGDLLIPSRKAFASRDLSEDESVEVGRTQDWFCLRTGPWTIHLKAEANARFPHIEDSIPTSGSEVGEATIDESDSTFLLDSLKDLPSNDEFNLPATVDLNGSVAVRAVGESQKTPMEIVLSNSARTGQAVRFSTNRNYLARAVRLGFRKLQVIGQDVPVCCRDEQRIYVWAVLGKDGIVPPHQQATRIASTKETSTNKPIGRTNTTMAATNRLEPTNDQSTSETATAIEEAESLRDTLQQALTQTRSLIAALKRQRKQSRLVQSTIKSLRQLQTIDV